MNSYKFSPMIWSWGVSPALHRNHKQNRTKGSKLQPSQLLSTTPCLVDGQVRVVVVAMVVINAHFPSLSLKKNRTKEIGLQTSTTETVDVCQLTLSAFGSTGGGMVMRWLWSRGLICSCCSVLVEGVFLGLCIRNPPNATFFIVCFLKFRVWWSGNLVCGSWSCSI